MSNTQVIVIFQALNTAVPTGLGVHCLPQPATLETSSTVYETISIESVPTL